MKLIYLYYKDQLPLKIKDIFTTNESVNQCNIRGGKSLFIPQEKKKKVSFFNTLKLIYLYYKDQLPLKIKDIFTTNESVNQCNIRGGKSLFIPQANRTHYGIKSLRYNGPVIRNDFFRNTDNNYNLFSSSNSKFKHYLKDLLRSQYNVDYICSMQFISWPFLTSQNIRIGIQHNCSSYFLNILS